MKCTVHTPYYDWDNRKYVEFSIENKVVRVKVPYRYGRVMCRVEGLRTVQELQKGEEVEIELIKKTWNGIEFLVLNSIKTE